MTEYRGVQLENTLENRIGAGAFGEVFQATERGGKSRTFAVKFIKCSHNEEVQSALDEIQAMMKLHHENIVKILDFGLRQFWELEVEYTLVLEYCSGGNLADRLGQTNLQSVKVSWIKSITSAIVYLHGEGITHQDLKPDNILLTADGVIKVADFGLARRFAQRNKDQKWREYYLTQGVGAKFYVAPEMLEEKHTQKVDVFSMGILFHAVLEGEFKVQDGRKHYGVFVKTDSEETEPIGIEMYNTRSDLTVPFRGRRRRLIIRMLKYDPKQRPTAKEVEDVLRTNWRRWIQLIF